MPKSTNMIGNMGTVITNGPAAASLALATAPGGPILDYAGNTNLALTKMKEAEIALNRVKTDTDGGDPNLTLINGLLAVLTGGGSPSTQTITDSLALAVSSPTEPSNVLAIAPGGPILDLVGMFHLIHKLFQELVPLLTYIQDVTDPSTDSANHTLIANLLLVSV